jgi:hypothetical protein
MREKRPQSCLIPAIMGDLHRHEHADRPPGEEHCLHALNPAKRPTACTAVCCIAQNHQERIYTAACRWNSIVHSSPCTVHNTHIHFTPTRFLSFWCMFRPKARSTAENYIKGRQYCQTSAPVGVNKLLRGTVRIFLLHCKKGYRFSRPSRDVTGQG